MSLDQEIEKAQRLVRTDSIQMSIGELATMYENAELIINPEFQRLFRWELAQKARLIESILLGIPVPSIFVFEKDDGTWELIDGLQRLSSVFEFMGILLDPDTRQQVVPSSMVATRYLRSLNNTVWQKHKAIIDPPFDEQIELDKKFQLSIRRSRLNVQILKRPSDSHTKFELFQRLNAGGTQANAQELRNSIVVMTDPSFNKIMGDLARNSSFKSMLGLNESQTVKKKDSEYVSRFLVYTYVPYDGTLDIEAYIDDGLMRVIKEVDRGRIARDFIGTFDLLMGSLGKNALKRFHEGKFSGRVGYTTFELIAIGIARNFDKISNSANPKQYVKDRFEAIWLAGHPDKLNYAGMRGTTRISKTLPFGTDWFNNG